MSFRICQKAGRRLGRRCRGHLEPELPAAAQHASTSHPGHHQPLDVARPEAGRLEGSHAPCAVSMMHASPWRPRSGCTILEADPRTRIGCHATDRPLTTIGCAADTTIYVRRAHSAIMRSGVAVNRDDCRGSAGPSLSSPPIRQRGSRTRRIVPRACAGHSPLVASGTG